METDTNITHSKMIELNDLLLYAKKYDKEIDNTLLQKNGFNPMEIEWVFSHMLKVKIHNKDLIIKQLKEKIKLYNNIKGETMVSKNKVSKPQSVTKSQLEVMKIHNREISKLKDIIKDLKKSNKVTSKVTSVQGWKGKDTIDIVRLDKHEWLVTEHRKGKHSGKVTKNKWYIKAEAVNTIWKIICMLTDKDVPKTNYRQIVSALIMKNNIDIQIDAFNGGRYRSKYLFPQYYYPMKIIESLGLIKYGGSGITKRLSFTRKRTV